MAPQEIKAVLEGAEIRMSEAADFFRIAHSTLYDWLNGVKPKNQVLYEYAVAVTKKIQRAKEAGKLPLQGVKGKERHGAIRAILAQV